MTRPNILKRLFTDFVTFTVKMAIKGQVSQAGPGGATKWRWLSTTVVTPSCALTLTMQICKEINKAANILAAFIQDTAGV